MLVDVPQYTMYAILSSSLVTLVATYIVIKYDNPLDEKGIMKRDKEEGVKEVIIFSYLTQTYLLITAIMYIAIRNNIL